MKIRKGNKRDDAITVNYLGILRMNTGDILDMVEGDCILKLIERNTINLIPPITASWLVILVIMQRAMYSLMKNFW